MKVAVDTCRGRMPIIAGAEMGTTTAVKYAQEAERLGSQGILLLPHDLTEAAQEGLVEHVEPAELEELAELVRKLGSQELPRARPAAARKVREKA